MSRRHRLPHTGTGKTSEQLLHRKQEPSCAQKEKKKIDPFLYLGHKTFEVHTALASFTTLVNHDRAK